MTTVIEVTGLRVEREAVILEAIDRRVVRGEHWVIPGANGSGKTSLLRALTGYLSPSSGEIRVLGETYGRVDWRDLRDRDRAGRSSVPRMDRPRVRSQNRRQRPLRAMDLWARPSRGVVSEGRKLLGFVGGAICAIVHGDLSQGERQRVLIARSLMARRASFWTSRAPDSIPSRASTFCSSSAGSPASAAHRRWSLVTHHVEEIVALFSHVLVLKAGRVLAA